MKDYTDKYFSVLGDSISTFFLYSPRSFYGIGNLAERESGVNTVEDTWWMQVINGLGGKLLVNNSYSGSLVVNHPESMDEEYGCSDKRTSRLGQDGVNPDVIMVYMGTNDSGWRVNLRGNDGDISCFESAYKAMLEKIKNNYPTAEIWCFTLCKAADKDCAYMGGYCSVIRECARLNGCKVFELYDSSESYDSVDGLHPNAEGMKTIARLVLGQIK